MIIFQHASDHPPKLCEQQPEDDLALAQDPTQTLGVVMENGAGGAGAGVQMAKHGHEFYSGCSRPKLYEWAAKGFIRSVSIREPGRIKGVRLFHLASILAFFERCEAGAFTEETNRQTR